MGAMTGGPRKILIVCTCRTPEWAPRRLGFILEIMNRSPVGGGCQMLRDPTGWGTGYRLSCDRCGRKPVLTVDNWRRLVAGLDEHDVPQLDIAALPF